MTVDEAFSYEMNCKWGTVVISDSNGKPFKITDSTLVFEMIMKSEASLVGLHGNNDVLNTMILKASEYPSTEYDNFLELSEEWHRKWGAKNHVLDCEIFKVHLFSSPYISPVSFIHPDTHKVGFVTECRWTYDTIECCREELEWVCSNFCKDKYEYYVSFFDNTYVTDPVFTLKLSSSGISVAETIPGKKLRKLMRKEFNHDLYGYEYRKMNFLYPVKNLLRKLQKIFFPKAYQYWFDNVLWGNNLNSHIYLNERFYEPMTQMIMIQLWKNYIKWDWSYE